MYAPAATFDRRTLSSAPRPAAFPNIVKVERGGKRPLAAAAEEAQHLGPRRVRARTRVEGWGRV